ncbi:MAG: lytic transglycosylase domain-containing protein [Candidatus Rokuibacteriota bacterium]|nr:MAG: lytic transglycosylase domain-containing protein [Candidatus Rokubacteria bacterium]
MAALLATIVWAAPADAETFKLTAPDGTVHFTNAPSDPQYQRMGVTSGTDAGWLRLPDGDTAPYLQEIRDAAERYGLPFKLVSAVIRAESGFNPRAVSPKGARGLMQLMPTTAATLGVRNSFDPRQNIEGGVRHLRSLIDRFINLPFALAAYNAGEKAVVQYGGIPPYPETQDYVTKVLYFYGGPVEGGTTPPTRIYQTVAPDGTIVYTNIPPRGRP